MRRTTLVLVLIVSAWSIGGCRASFEDIEKQALVSTQDDLGGKSSEDSTKKPEDFPELETEKELPREESPAYNCDGVVVMREKGKDKNRDGVLQPTEVTEVSTVCKPDPKDSQKPSDPKPHTKPDCPSQSGKNCPKDDPTQNDPGQGGKY